RRRTGDHIHDPRLAALPLVFRLADHLRLLHPLGRAVVAHNGVSAAVPRPCRASHRAKRLPARYRIDDLRAVCGPGGDRSLVLSPPRHPEQLKMSLSAHEATRPDRQRYFDHIAAERGPVAEIEPACLYPETTNRCNLLCTTCPRTFEALEPAEARDWELFAHIVDQF